MTAIDEMLAANATAPYVASDDARPSRRVAIVTCMDARIDPYALFGLGSGQVHVLRNAGGLVTDDVERSLVVSQHALGTTEVMVVHHSGCGMSGDGVGLPDAPWEWGFFADVEADVRAGVERLRSSPLLPHTDGVRGFVLDISSGRVAEVL